MSPTLLALRRAEARLADRLAELERQLDAGDVEAWREYRETAGALAAIVPATAPGSGGRLLTSRELAEALNLSSRTVRRYKKSGKLEPALQIGRTLRWRAGGPA